MQPEPDYAGAETFLKAYCAEIGLEYSSHEFVKGKPNIVMTWRGTKPELGSVLLNSHIDVVPVSPDQWEHPPFSAHKTDDGWIYGRGTQDMKCVGIWYMEAIRKLKETNFTPERTIHVIWVPDEGQPGHGSQFIPNSVGEKLRVVIDRFMDYRAGQEKKMIETKCPIGEVTTVNLTMLNGGVQYNVVPDKLQVGFDMRVTPLYDLDVFDKQIHAWCKEAAGDDYEIRWVQRFKSKNMTSVEPGFKWWDAFSRAVQPHPLVKTIFPAATDSRYIRAAGIPALGFSPIKNHPILLHDHNERLHESCLIEGREIYIKLISELTKVE